MNITLLDDCFDTPDEGQGQPDDYDAVGPLILDLLEWIGSDARPYSEVIDIWRTSCPRLPVWEEANARGYLTRLHTPGGAAEVKLSEAGAAHLSVCRGRTMGRS